MTAALVRRRTETLSLTAHARPTFKGQFLVHMTARPHYNAHLRVLRPFHNLAAKPPTTRMMTMLKSFL
jgi:hypothetical protein